MPDQAPRWQVIFERQAEKVLRRLPRDLLRRLDAEILGLAANPWPAGCIKLKGHTDLFRTRVGDWRITYAVKEDKLIILVTEIAPRGGAYKKL